MKKKLKMTAVTAVILFCMLQGCEKKEKQGEEILLLPVSENKAEQDTDVQGTDTVDKSGADGCLTQKDEEQEAEVQCCVVHICGAVKEPGVYTLEEKSRIYQAVEAAGGFREDAASDYLNQADRITDGMKIYIPSESEVENAQIVGDWSLAGSDNQENPLVNINTAGEELLCTLPGVGESKAKSIIDYREKNGGFQKIEDIMNVEGIKEGLFQKMKDSITV